MVITLLFCLVVVFSFLDAYQTSLLLRFGCYEANPIMAYFIDKFGLEIGLYIPKAITLTVLVLLLVMYQNKTRGMNNG